MKRIRKKRVLVLILLLPIALIAVARSGNRRVMRQSMPAIAQGLPITVATLNTQLLPPIADQLTGSRSDDPERTRKIAAQLRSADLVGFCEVFHEKNAALLIDAMNSDPQRSFAFVRSPEPKSWNQFASGGLIFFSRYPIQQHHTLAFADGSRLYSSRFQAADGLAAKGALHVRIQVNATATIDCFLTHLESYSATIRSRQITQLADFVESNSRADSPSLIMGDFNVDGPISQAIAEAQPDSEYARLLRALSFGRRRVRDLMIEGNANASGTSDPLAPGGGRRIDFILLSEPNEQKRLWNAEARTLPLLDVSVPEGSLSDHAAVRCELNLPSRETTGSGFCNGPMNLHSARRIKPSGSSVAQCCR